MRNASLDIATEMSGESPRSSESIANYIYKGSVYDDTFREFLEENGIEGSDQRRLEQ